MIDEREVLLVDRAAQWRGKTQEAIVKDVQMHPAGNSVVHVDLQRVVENEKLRIRLPIHFKARRRPRA